MSLCLRVRPVAVEPKIYAARTSFFDEKHRLIACIVESNLLSPMTAIVTSRSERCVRCSGGLLPPANSQNVGVPAVKDPPHSPRDTTKKVFSPTWISRRLVGVVLIRAKVWG